VDAAPQVEVAHAQFVEKAVQSFRIAKSKNTYVAVIPAFKNSTPAIFHSPSNKIKV